ncbi:MAG TPA: hypothetical protein VN809_07350, partial [Telmatospirillum sp.]|nr:hypothetical protein [Telmatospirillum sp.]
MNKADDFARQEMAKGNWGAFVAPPSGREANRPSKINLRIVILVFACVLPLWIATSVQIYQSYQARQEQTLTQTLATTRGLMLTVDRELSTAESALRALATSPAFATADLAAIHRQIKTLLASFPGADIIVADKAGQQLVNSFRAL